MKKIFPLLILILSFSACQTETPKPKTAQEIEETSKKVRESTAAEFQKYVDAHYPGWKVKGWRKDEEVKSDSDDVEKTYYYLLLTKESKERTILVMSAIFEMADGQPDNVFFEISSRELKTIENKKKTEKEREKLDEAMREAEEDSRADSDPRR